MKLTGSTDSFSPKLPGEFGPGEIGYSQGTSEENSGAEHAYGTLVCRGYVAG